MWMKNASRDARLETADFTGKLGGISTAKPTTFADPDCYTFETFASYSDEIHTAYYYHYKRTRAGLKEETKWS